jgi:hypothetical protein
LKLAVEELFRIVGITEADSDNTLGFLVIDGAVGDVAPLLGGLGHVFLDFTIDLVVLNLLESEDVLDDDDFAPLVPLGSVDLGDFLFIVRPLGELTVRLLAMKRNMACFFTRTG